MRNDPVLNEAANRIEPVLKQDRFADSYAGLRLDQQAHRLEIHRLPDAERARLAAYYETDAIHVKKARPVPAPMRRGTQAVKRRP